MQVAVKGVNLTLTPGLRRAVEAKVLRVIERLLGRHPAYAAAALDVELVSGRRHHKKGMVWEAVANLELPRNQIVERVSSFDLHAAIDELGHRLRRELTQWKERSRSRLLRGARRMKRSTRFDRSARLPRRGRVRQEGK